MPLSKTLQRLAADIAVSFRKNQPPSLDEKILHYVEHHPQEVLGMLEALAGQTAGKDDNLTKAYLMLLGFQLEYVRYQVDRNYDWAKELAARFQQQALDQANAGRLSDTALQQIIVALHEARLEVDPRLFQAVTANLEAEASSHPEPPPMDDLLASLARDTGGNEFQVTAMLAEVGYPMPVELRLMLAAAMLDSSHPALQNAVPLLLLDDMGPMRRGVMQILQQGVKRLPPVGLRRLIAIRNWLPADERPSLDPIIKAARQQGVECAQWPPGAPAEIHASAVDGSGAIGFMVVTAANRKYTLSSILLRLQVGVLDAWRDPTAHSKRVINQFLSQMQQAQPAVVSRVYLDRAIRRHLAVGVRQNKPPPAGLLAVAELLGATDWQPDEIDLETAIEELFQKLPQQFQQADAVERCLRESTIWATISGVTESWFEDDQAVAELLSGSRTRKPDTLAKQVLSQVIEPHRLRWAEKLFWAALWFREQRPDAPLWINFLQVARVLVKGYPVEKIPLMEDIAHRTVQVLSER